jgi:hypothetical protein
MKFLSPPIPRLPRSVETLSDIDMTTSTTVLKGIAGASSSVLAVVGSMIDGVEVWLRIAALIAGGIVVPTITSYSLWLTIQAKRDYNRRKQVDRGEKH